MRKNIQIPYLANLENAKMLRTVLQHLISNFKLSKSGLVFIICTDKAPGCLYMSINVNKVKILLVKIFSQIFSQLE